MKTEQYDSESLYCLIERQKAVTLEEMKITLGTTVDRTVFRKLQQFDYCSSYSHRGSYYTLKKLTNFDEQGLWTLDDIWFSKYGTLMATAEAFVNKSEAGFFVQELSKVLHVCTKESLLKLFRAGRLVREKKSGLYLYCSADWAKRRQQLKSRKILETELILSHGLKGYEVSPDKIKAAIILFLSLLDEKQRRLYAGLESLRHGYGGDRKIADVFSMDVHTVAQGRKELICRDTELEGARKKGGGRKSVKKTPEIIAEIEELMKYEEAGDSK